MSVRMTQPTGPVAVDWGSPVNDKLCGWWTPVGGTFRNLVVPSKADCTPTAVVPVVSPYGIASRFNGSSSKITAPLSAAMPGGANTPFAFECLVNLASLPAFYSLCYFTGTIEIYGTSAGALSIASSGFSVSAGVSTGLHHIVYSRDASTSYFMLDGVSYSGTYYGTAIATSSVILGAYQGTSEWLNGDIIYARLLNRYMSGQEARLRWANPWAGLIAEPRRVYFGVTAGGGALVGSSTLSFSPAAILAGAGAMLASSTLSFAPTATALGAGALAGSGTLTLNPAATLVAAAILAGSATVSFAPTATILGAGDLAGSGVVSFVGSGAMLGAGAIAGSSEVSFAPAAVMVGAGALAGSGVITLAPSGTLDLPPGALVGTSTVTLTPTATALGAGAVAGSSVVTIAPAGTVTGAAPMAASATITISPSAALAADGTLAGSSVATFSPTGTVTAGAGSISGSSTLTFAPQATMAAAGALAGSSVLSLVLLALMGSIGGQAATQRVLRIAAENRIMQIAAQNRNLTIH